MQPTEATPIELKGTNYQIQSRAYWRERYIEKVKEMRYLQLAAIGCTIVSTTVIAIFLFNKIDYKSISVCLLLAPFIATGLYCTIVSEREFRQLKRDNLIIDQSRYLLTWSHKQIR